MRSIVWIVMMAFLAGILACGSQEEPKGKQPVTGEQVKQQTKEAAEAAKTYAAQKKDEYQQKIAAKLNDLQAKIDELKAKAETAKPEVKAKLDEQIAALQKDADAAKAKMQDLKSAGADAWEKLKAGTDSAVDKLQQDYEKAKDLLK